MAKGKGKAKVEARQPVLVVEVFADGDSFVPEVTTDLSVEVVEELLRQTADAISGKNDRAAGAWGR